TRNAAPVIPGVLKIAPIKSYGIYRERALLYSRETDPHGLQQHRYHYWIDTPTRLIRDQLIEFLRASGVAGGIAGSQASLSGDLRLKLTLKQLERVIHTDRQVSVKVALDALIATADGRTLKITGYTHETAATDASIPASVSAIDQTLNRIYFEILGDLQTL
ncbi:MAG: ABC-type transport auxiliary lipoprotein family protein, partial [Candidatus Thiodiazotropha sp.]